MSRYIGPKTIVVGQVEMTRCYQMKGGVFRYAMEQPLPISTQTGRMVNSVTFFCFTQAELENRAAEIKVVVE